MLFTFAEQFGQAHLVVEAVETLEHNEAFIHPQIIKLFGDRGIVDHVGRQTAANHAELRLARKWRELQTHRNSPSCSNIGA